MNKQFKDFIKRSEEKKLTKNGCFHDKDRWCQNCINFGQDVEQILPDGSISRGRLITNKVLDEDEWLEIVEPDTNDPSQFPADGYDANEY